MFQWSLTGNSFKLSLRSCLPHSILFSPAPSAPLRLVTPLPPMRSGTTPLTPSRWPLAGGGDDRTWGLFPQVPVAALSPTLLLVDRHDPAITAEVRRQLRQSLSPLELERLQRYRLPQDADRFLLGRGLLRCWLARLLPCTAKEVTIFASAHGKPVLAGEPHFNVSHSGDLILLAVHRQRAVGVDLERDRQRLAWPAIARRYLGEAGLERLRRDHPDERSQRRAFLLEWCCLEARLKADGRGLRGQSSPGAKGLDGPGDGAQSAWAGGCWPLQLPAGYQGAAALLPVSGWAAVGLAGASTASGPIHIASP